MNTFATLTPRQQEHFRAYLTETQHHAKCVQEFIMGDSEPLKDRLARMEKRAKATLETIEAIKQECTLVEQATKKARLVRLADEITNSTPLWRIHEKLVELREAVKEL